MEKKSTPKLSFFLHNSLKKTARVLKNWECQFFLYLNLGLKITFLFLLFSFLFLNLYSLTFPEREELDKVKRKVLLSPFEPKTHVGLAKTYLKLGYFELAEKELMLAKSLTSTPPLSLKEVEKALKEAKEEPQKTCQEIAFWEKAIQEKPDYRDAYFQLAVLYSQLSQKEKAREYLQKTLKLDPNFEAGKKLDKILNP